MSRSKSGRVSSGSSSQRATRRLRSSVCGSTPASQGTKALRSSFSRSALSAGTAAGFRVHEGRCHGRLDGAAHAAERLILIHTQIAVASMLNEEALERESEQRQRVRTLGVLQQPLGQGGLNRNLDSGSSRALSGPSMTVLYSGRGMGGRLKRRGTMPSRLRSVCKRSYESIGSR